MLLVQHDIRTESGKVIWEGLHSIPSWLRGAIEREIKTMLELGVIKESKSSWRHPIVLIPQPDDSLHFLY